jgi:uncharacterized protein (DUF58 family)
MKTVLHLARAGFHTGLLFLLPWILGMATGAAFDIKEVSETGGNFFFYFMIVTMPLLFLQMVSVTIRVRREMRAKRVLGKHGFEVFAEALERHARLLTGRGVGLVVGSSIALMSALAVRWGQFAVMAVAGLGLLYIIVTAAAVASAFSILSFDERSQRRRGKIERRMVPALAGVGDPVQEEFQLEHVPIPPLYRLHISEDLPARLGGETRFALDRNASSEHVTVRAPLTQTLRGVFRFGPAHIAYEDIFGLTHVEVASLAQVDLRVMPNLRTILFDKKPKSLTRGDGAISRQEIFPTDDYFRLREYQRGDDARRVHWKRSIQLGAMHIRLPETVPYKPKDVILVLDTYLPERLAQATGVLADALDLLVEAWLSMARSLMQKGERVTLVVATPNEEGNVVFRVLPAKNGEVVRWRSVGADVAWQSDWSPERIASELATRGLGAEAVWVSSVLHPLPMGNAPQMTVIWVPPRAEGKERTDRTAAQRFFAYAFPSGADDNRFNWRAFWSPKPSTYTALQMVEHTLARAGAWLKGHGQASFKVLVLRRTGAALTLGEL